MEQVIPEWVGKLGVTVGAKPGLALEDLVARKDF